MERTQGRADVAIALLDGPVASGAAALVSAHIREVPCRSDGSFGARALRGLDADHLQTTLQTIQHG
jgi:hypothetical protein